MKAIEIIGDNYFGAYSKTRVGCRAIIMQDGEMILSYGTKTDEWMIPGGGLEGGETEKECCIREVAEETGLIVEPSECLLEIDEYYKDWRFVNKYFVCKAVGKTEMKLTKPEIAIGMEPRRIAPDEIMRIFANYRAYADTDEMRRGMYLREYTALTELSGQY